MEKAATIHKPFWKHVGGCLGVALVCVLLCACGQSGDLYLPPDKSAESSGQAKASN